MLFRKRPVRIYAVQLSQATQVETLEGIEQANPGDWLITGLLGEKWPSSKDSFERNYSAESTHGYFRANPKVVTARQVSGEQIIQTAWGQQFARTGDWIVDDGNSLYVCQKDAFATYYEPCGGL
jgi:hypothetical protein